MVDEGAAKTAVKNTTKTGKKINKGLIGGIIAAVAVVVVIICVFVLSTPKVVGKYTLEAFVEDGKESTEVVKLLEIFGGSYKIEFRKDKTGVFEAKAGTESEKKEFKWDSKSIKFEGEDEENEYEFKDDTITVTVEGKGMKFKREETK
jgi:hypothetical protein